jgi:glycosyltransferase involved in cell wall biosynthesis
MDDDSARPLISIIIPTLNVESVIAACVDSIERQTFRNYEVVIVDGFSTDKTAEIALGCQATLGGRLSVHVEKDEGVYDAMNKGVARARGHWLLFLGADDLLHHEDTLTQVTAILHQDSTSQLVYGDVVMRSNSSRYGGVFDLDKLLFEKNICHQAIFYRREVFAHLGPYNLRYRIWADWDFNIRCFQNPTLATRYVDIVVANYNDTGGLSLRMDSELQKRLPVFLLNATRRKWDARLRRVARLLFPGFGKNSR